MAHFTGMELQAHRRQCKTSKLASTCRRGWYKGVTQGGGGNAKAELREVSGVEHGSLSRWKLMGRHPGPRHFGVGWGWDDDKNAEKFYK